MNQIVRYDRFGAREMIEEENLSLFDVAIGVVQFDIGPETLFDGGQGLNRPRAGRLVYFQRVSYIGEVIFTFCQAEPAPPLSGLSVSYVGFF